MPYYEQTTVSTGTFAWQLPTGTAIFGNDIFPFVHGITGAVAPQMQQASFLLLEGYMANFFQPSGTASVPAGFITGSYTLLDGRYQPSGTAVYNIQFHVGDGSAVVATGSTFNGYPWVEIPAATQIDSWEATADATGTMVLNVLRSTNAAFPPASPLAGLGQVTLTNQRKTSGNPTGTVLLAQGDYIQAQVSSASTVKLVTVSLRARKV